MPLEQYWQKGYNIKNQIATIIIIIISSRLVVEIVVG